MLCPTRCVSCSSPRDVLTLAQDDKDVTQLEDKIKRKKNKIKNSEILDALRDEFGQAPEVKTSLSLSSALLTLSLSAGIELIWSWEVVEGTASYR
jgi:hypothetical protein